MMHQTIVNKYSVLILLTCFIAACGGGGGGGGGDAPSGAGGSSSGGSSSGGGSGGSTPTTPPTAQLNFNSASIPVGDSITLTWSSSNTTGCDASNGWSGAKGTSGSETITLTESGTYVFTLSCTNGSASVSTSQNLEVYKVISGIVLDGYIRGSEVFVDTNDNKQLDTNEPSVTTDNAGAFSNLRLTSGNLISIGGLDAATNITLDKFWLTSHSGDNLNLIISPVTSIATLLLPQNKDAAYVKSMLGIDSSIDIYTQDPLVQLDQAIYKNLYIVGNKTGVFSLSLQNFFNAHGGASDSTSEYFKIMAETLQSSYDQNQSAQIIDDPSVFGNVIDQVVSSKSLSVSSQTLDDFKALMESLYYIDYKNNNSIDLGLQNFMLQTLQDDVKLVAQNNLGSSTLNSYKNTLVEYIANDQNLTTADIDIPITANNDSVQLIEDVNAQVIEVFSNDKFKRSQSISLDFTGVTSAGATFQANNTNADPGNIKHTSSPAGNSINTNPYINGISYSPQLNFCGQDSFEYTLIQGSQKSTAEVSVEVACTNDNPTVISRNFSNTGGGTAVFDNVGANDIDGDALSYSIGGTDAQYISVAGNGDLNFTNAVSYASPSDSNGDNIYQFTVTVNDGSTSVTQSFQVEVLPGGSAPVFSSWSPIPTTFIENQSISIQIIASDPDGDAMSLSISNPSGFSIASNANGFEITNSSGLAAGSYTVKGVITDNNSGKTTPFGIDVLVKALGWQQLGPDIDGKIFGENSGKSVAMSRDGNTIAIGSPRPGTNGGIIRVYEFNGSGWTLKGDELTMSGDNLDAGYSLAISDTGNRLIWGAPSFNGAGVNAGMVQVYEYSSGSWSQLGPSFNGTYQYSRMGKSVDISADGNSIIIGADEGKGDPNNSDGGGQQGLFKVYNYNRNNSTWSQVGSTIYGQAVADYDGDSVQINQDGTRIAAGAFRHDATGTDSGWVRVYELVNDEWSILGNTISFGGGTFWGAAVAMSSDGSTVAALAPGYNENGNRSGQVRVFDYANGQWMQHGNAINGEAAGDHLIETGTLALNSDGSRLIIGADLNDAGSLDTEDIGHARVYRYNSECTSSTCAEVDTWIQVGDDIDGESFKDRSGSSVGISADGKKVIIGALCNDGDTNNNVDCRGHARVYEYID